MKISNSKKQLAEIIHANGGWYDGATFYCQDRDGEIFPYNKKPSLPRGGTIWHHSGVISGGSIKRETPIKNWHQTILSRDEYFYLYPDLVAACEALGAVLSTVGIEPVVEAKPTIEQLAADYHNRRDYADRKKQEADAAKADAEAKLVELVAVGKALGLVLGVAEPEPELETIDWWDLQVGDRIWVGDSGSDSNCPAGEYDISDRDFDDDDQPVGVMWRGLVQWPQIHKRGWRFINRPAKGGADA